MLLSHVASAATLLYPPTEVIDKGKPALKWNLDIDHSDKQKYTVYTSTNLITGTFTNSMIIVDRNSKAAIIPLKLGEEYSYVTLRLIEDKHCNKHTNECSNVDECN